VQPVTLAQSTYRSLSLQGLGLVALSALLTSTANLLFRAAMSQTSNLSYPAIVSRLLQCPPFYLGWGCYGIAAVIWFRVLKAEPLSSSYPILMGLTFIIVSTGAIVLFNEQISFMKIAGMIAILFGIVLVSRA
jgi:multidrug transporter EmrE-like cation transporter